MQEILTGGGGQYEYIAYLDDDDEWLPEKLQRQIEKFNECGENVGLVYCGFYLCDDVQHTSHEVRKAFAGDNIRDELMRRNAVGSPSCVLVRTKVLQSAGGFDTELASGIEDWDMWMRVAELCGIAYVDMSLVNYYLGHSQRTDQNDNAAASERLRRSIRETCHVLEKNKEYFTRNKYAHWVRLSGLAVNYRKNGEFTKSFATFFKAVSLQPLRVLGNIRILFGIIFPAGAAFKEKLRAALQKVFPERLYWGISSCYRKLMRKFF